MSAAHSSAACAAHVRTDRYARRTPEQTLLYQLVEEHWPRFLEREWLVEHRLLGA